MEELEEAGLSDQAQQIVFATFQVGKEPFRDVVRGIQLRHVFARKEIAQQRFDSERARENMREGCSGFARVATVAGVQ